jgi:hypothetical protein
MLDPSFERSTNVIPKGVRFSMRGGCPNPDNSFDHNDRDSRNTIPGISPRERRKKENERICEVAPRVSRSSADLRHPASDALLRAQTHQAENIEASVSDSANHQNGATN